MKKNLLLFLSAILFLNCYAQRSLIDTTFGIKGKVTTAFSVASYARSIAIQNDGKILMAGTTNLGNYNNQGDFCIARYLVDGRLDTSFGIGGKVITDMGNARDECSQVAIQNDGKIIVSGGTIYAGNSQVAMVRYNTNGSIDSTFGNSGKVISRFGGDWIFGGLGSLMSLQSDGKIVLAGNLDTGLVMQRYNSNGSVDSTFGQNAFVFIALDGIASITSESNGKILVGGYLDVIAEKSAIIRYKSNGVIDSSFGINGISKTSFNLSKSFNRFLLRQPDNKIISIGTISYAYPAHSDLFLTRLDTLGAIDSTYGTNGIEVISRSTYFDDVFSTAFRTDGKLLTLNYHAGRLMLIQFQTNGKLDTTFGFHGKYIESNSKYGDFGGILSIQNDNKILLGGTVEFHDTDIWNNLYIDSFALGRLLGCSNSYSTETVSGWNTVSVRNKTYSNTGIYYDTLMNYKGCDSIIKMNITVKKSSNSTQSIIACSKYTWQGKTFYSSGIYYDTIPNIAGCDSFMVLILTLKNTSSTISITACDSLFWLNKEYKVSGVFVDSIPNSSGCDSIITLNLIIKQHSVSSQSIQSCDSFLWQNKIFKSSGVYYDTITNTVGCDSILKLILTINKSSSSVLNLVACNQYFWRNVGFTKSGVYTNIIPNSVGCDSILTLNLTINSSTNSSSTIAACNSYLWQNKLLTSSGFYLDTLLNSLGCDSILSLNLNLTVNDKTISKSGNILTSNANVTTYQWLDCATNTAISGATNKSMLITKNGNYACILSKNSCIDTSICYVVSGIGIKKNDHTKNFTIYPNPTQGNFILDLGEEYEFIELQITNILGQAISVSNYRNAKRIYLEIKEVPGIYFLQIKTQDGVVTIIKVVNEK